METLVGVPVVIASFCVACQWCWSSHRLRQRDSFPVVMPFAAVWCCAIALTVLLAITLPDAWVAKLSLVSDSQARVNDGWMILLVMAHVFAVIYGVASLIISAVLIWKKRKLKEAPTTG